MVVKVFVNAILPSRRSGDNVLILSTKTAILVAQELTRRGFKVGSPDGIIVAEDDMFGDTTSVWMNLEDAKLLYRHMASTQNIEAVTTAYAQHTEGEAN